MKILIVEDDQISRNLLQKMLERYGKCHVTENGKAGLEAVTRALQEEDPYQLICLDIMMPELDGLQCLKEIRAQEKKCAEKHLPAKIIMTTAVDAMQSVMEAYSQGGCNAYLIKPFEHDVLEETLRLCDLPV